MRHTIVPLVAIFTLLIAASAGSAAPSYFPVDREFFPYYPSLIKWDRSNAGFTEPEVCQGCDPQQYDEWNGSVHALAFQDPIYHFVAEPGERMWAQVNEVLWSRSSGDWQRERFDFDPKAAVYALAPDGRRGGVWLAVTAPNPLPQHGARILKFEAGKLARELEPYPCLQDSQRTRGTTMLQDRRGRLWVGTWVDGGFYWEAGQGWRQPVPDQPRSWHPVDALAEEEDGLIWMVTRDGGLHRIAERKVTVLSPPEETGRGRESGKLMPFIKPATPPLTHVPSPLTLPPCAGNPC